MRIIGDVLLGVLLLGGFAAEASAQERPSALAPYLLEEAREVALARSAAPAAVADDATVYVLRPNGYERVAEGRSGFACLVERSFTAPTTDPEEFYEPRVLAPICFSPAAAATLMQRDLLIAPLVARAVPLPDIRQAEAAAYASGTLRYPERAVFAYMLSSAQWLGASIGHWHPHVMVWAPGVDAEDLLPSGLRSFGPDSGLPLMDTRYGPRQTLVVIPVSTSISPTRAPRSGPPR